MDFIKSIMKYVITIGNRIESQIHSPRVFKFKPWDVQVEKIGLKGNSDLCFFYFNQLQGHSYRMLANFSKS